MRRLLQNIGIFFGLLVILGFIANLIIDNPYTHRLARAAINERLTRDTYLALDFKAVKVKVFPPSLELYGVSLSTSQARRKPLITTSKLTAKLSVWSLFLGDIRIGLIEATDFVGTWPPPWGFQGFVKDDVNAPPKVSQGFTWPPDINLPIETVRLRNALLYVEFPLENEIPKMPSYQIVSALGVNAEIELGSFDDMDVQIEAQSLNVAEDESSFLEDSKLELSMEIRDDRLTVSRLTIAGERLDYKASGLGTFLRSSKTKVDGFELKANYTANLDLSVLGSYLEIGETRGATKTTGDLDLYIPFGNRDEPRFSMTGKAKTNGGLIDGFRIYNTEADYVITEDNVVFRDIALVIGETVFAKGSGSIGFDDPIALSFDLETMDLRLRDLLDAFDVSFDVFDFSLNTKKLLLSGTGEPFALTVKTEVDLSQIDLPSKPYDRSRFPLSPSCKAKLELAIDEDQLDFGSTSLSCLPDLQGEPHKETELLLTGKLAFDDSKGVDLKLSSRMFELRLAEFFAQVPLRGGGPVAVQVHGPYDNVLIDADVEFASTEVSEVPLGKVTAKIRATDNDVTWTSLRANLEPIGLVTSKTGKLDFSRELLLDFDLSAEVIPSSVTAKIVKLIDKDLPLAFGIETLRLSAKGPLDKPFAQTTELELSASNGRFDGESIFDRLSVEASSTAGGWRFPKIQAALASLHLEGKIVHQHTPGPIQDGSDLASIGLHKNDQLVIEVATLDKVNSEAAKTLALADHLGTLPYVGKTLRDANIRSSLSMAMHLEGSFTNLNGTFEGALKKPQVLGSSLAPITFRGFYRDGDVNTVLNHSGNAFEGRIGFDLSREGVPYEWYFGFTRFDVRSLATPFFAVDARNYAYLTGNWQMQGMFRDFWKSTGTLNLQDILVSYVRDIGGTPKTLNVNLDQPASMQINQDGWNFASDQSLSLSGKHGSLKISTENNRPPDALNTKFECVLDVEVVRELFAQVENATGRIMATGAVTGKVSEPTLAAELSDLKPSPFNSGTWAPVSLGLAEFRPSLRNIRFKVRYDQSKFFVDSFSAEKGNGRITSSGVLHFSEDQSVESVLNLSFQDAALVYPLPLVKTVDTTLNGNVSLSGTRFPLRLSGDIVVSRARATREVDLKDEILNAIRRSSINITTVDQKPYLELDLNISGDKTISVQNQTIQALLSTNLQITGSETSPIINGEIDIERGKLIYKRDFSVTRGAVLFDDPVKPDPSLDILAVANVQNYRVYVSVTGRASAPQFDLSVDPPTREDGTPISTVDILVLLNSGSLPDATRAVGETQGTAASETINLFFGFIDEPVEKLLDLSGQSVVRNPYIDFYPSEEGNPVPRLNLPLDFGRDFDVVIRVDQSTRELSGEYDLHEAISVTGGIEQQFEETQNTPDRSETPFDAAFDVKFGFSFD